MIGSSRGARKVFGSARNSSHTKRAATIRASTIYTRLKKNRMRDRTTAKIAPCTPGFMAMKKGKSPGWDGIPPELYLAFLDELGQPLLDMILHSVHEGSFNNSANLAIITLLPKPDKDLTLCGNHRPLSLLNSDVKLYAKVLASRLDAFMTKLVNNDL
ncbi:hypothetical protein QQF64_035903 [Cirrhinus molitorella]|uniref:Reverse transcriptase n=1 Tax=Cirrhinus molitorella TaxID=172907 RepID=A0ABR3NI27_9TELE